MRLGNVLAPRDREFFDLFEEAGGNASRATSLLHEMLAAFPERPELAREVLLCEQEGDRITHDIIQRLNQTFVTPIDREDIYELASALDDVVDFTEEVADYLGLYKIEAPMEQAQELARVLHSAARQIAEALWLADRSSQWIPTPELNRFLGDLQSLREPPAVRGKRLRMYYMAQFEASPPRFAIQVNNRGQLTRDYAYFLENRLRERYRLHGVPLVIDFKTSRGRTAA